MDYGHPSPTSLAATGALTIPVLGLVIDQTGLLTAALALVLAGAVAIRLGFRRNKKVTQK